MKTKIMLSIACAVVLSSCGGKVDEAKQAMDNLESIAKSGDQMQATQDAATKRREERRAKGDTLAIPYAELQKLLPADLSGYTAKDPEGSNTDMPGYSMGQASRSYEKPDGSYVKITLTDWNASEAGWAGASAMFSMKIRVDNSNETSGTIQTDDPLVNGMEHYGKQDKQASVTYAIGARFLLMVEANNQTGTDMVKQVAQRLDLKKLASM